MWMAVGASQTWIGASQWWNGPGVRDGGMGGWAARIRPGLCARAKEKRRKKGKTGEFLAVFGAGWFGGAAWLRGLESVVEATGRGGSRGGVRTDQSAN